VLGFDVAKSFESMVAKDGVALHAAFSRRPPSISVESTRLASDVLPDFALLWEPKWAKFVKI
jgi:hypothetical protein